MSNSNHLSVDISKSIRAINPIPVRVRFWMNLTDDVHSVACTAFVFSYVLFERTLDPALHNHVIIIVLIIDLIDASISISWLLDRYQYGILLVKSFVFQLFSFFFDYATLSIQLVLLAKATIVRHLLIDHDQWLSIRERDAFSFMTYPSLRLSPIGKSENSFVSFLPGGDIIPCVCSHKVLANFRERLSRCQPQYRMVIY